MLMMSSTFQKFSKGPVIIEISIKVSGTFGTVVAKNSFTSDLIPLSFTKKKIAVIFLFSV